MEIKDIINKSLWDGKEDKSDYSFFYTDRITKKEIELKGDDILKLDGNFIVVERFVNDKFETAEIPMHRIRYIKKKGEKIFERPM